MAVADSLNRHRLDLTTGGVAERNDGVRIDVRYTDDRLTIFPHIFLTSYPVKLGDMAYRFCYEAWESIVNGMCNSENQIPIPYNIQEILKESRVLIDSGEEYLRENTAEVYLNEIGKSLWEYRFLNREGKELLNMRYNRISEEPQILDMAIEWRLNDRGDMFFGNCMRIQQENGVFELEQVYGDLRTTCLPESTKST